MKLLVEVGTLCMWEQWKILVVRKWSVVVLKILSSLQEWELNSPPFGCGLDLVYHF
jgi:hypothetical protein